MKALDRYLQRVRINKAKKYIRKGDTVLDIGSVDGVMFEALQGIIEKGFGIDPTLTQQIETPLYTLIPGYFPEVSPKGLQYDVITMLAVLEHIPTHLQIELANNCLLFQQLYYYIKTAFICTVYAVLSINQSMILDIWRL
jgi:2-polyprenyl-3-methyl-5-hydroxy-6-metoxy-1,4-benzoquinol methylase